MRASPSLILRTVAWCIGVLVLGGALIAGVVVGAGTLLGPPEAEASRETAEPAATQDFVRLAANDPAAALRSCVPARQTDVDALSAALPSRAIFGAARYTTRDGDLMLVSAPVTGAGLTAGEGDRAVWAYGRQGWAAVTDDARVLSRSLPGPQLYGVSPDSPGVVRAATCVEAAQRVR